MSTPSTALRDPGPWKPLKDERRTIRELKALELLALLDVSYRDGLVKLRTIAVRKGLWFKALSAVERAVVDLTIRVVERVRSSALKRALESIASKVVGALKLRSFRERALAVGRALAERVARAAERLGCERAKDWARGPCFAMYLGVSWPNTSPVFRCPL
jgi:hypothetical protein